MKKIIRELRSIALSRPYDCLRWNDGALELKPLDEIPARGRAGIARIERNSTGVKVVFYDKLKAIELLLKLDGEGSNTPENNLLEAILQATSAPVDFGDILEMGNDDDNGILIEQ